MDRRRSPFRSTLALGAVLAVLYPGPAAAEQVPIRVATHEGYGRIVFNWPAPVPYAADISGGRLVVRFGRPIEAAFGGVARSLGKYLSGAEPGADGRSAVFTLRGDFGLRSFDLGKAVVVDLLDAATPSTTAASAAGAPTTAPAAPAAQAAGVPTTAEAGPRLGVRTGEHEGFTRIVFDWPAKVGYQVRQAGGTVTVTFARPARVDLGALRSRSLKFVRGATAAVDDGRLRVVLTVPETSRVRDFLSGPKVVLDVMAPSEAETAAAAKPAPAPAPVPAATPSAAGVQPETPSAAARAVTSAKAGMSAKAETSARAGTPAKAEAPVGAGTVAKPTPLVPGQPTALTPPPTNLALATQQQGAAAPAQPPPGAPAAQPGTGGVPATAPVTAVATATLTGPADAKSLRFDWGEPVAAAVFRRAGYLWVVFDKPTKIDVAGLRAAAGNLIRDIEQIPSEQASILRMSTVSGINPSIRRDGLAWILDFRRQPLQAQTPIETLSQPNSPIGARLFLPVTEPGDAVVFRDPEVGDNIVVVPVIPLGHGVSRDYEYPQARILRTGQGAVIQPRSDDLRVRPLRQGIELTSASGLRISAVTVSAAADTKLATMRPLTRVFDFKKWGAGDLKSFTKNKQRLQGAVAKAKGAGREKARLDLARLYFANGFSAETLGVLRLVAEDRPGILDEPEFRAMRGAASFLMGRLADARADFHHPSLDENDEGIFWRASVRAAEGDTVGAAKNLRRTGAITRPYPKALKMPMGLLIVEAAIDVGDIKQANRFLEALINENPNLAQKNQLDYVEGRFRELGGDFDGAVGKWEEAQEGPHRPSRAKAAVARTELLLKLRRFTKADAIRELEKLRFAWRGDEFEFALLRRLGRLYLNEGNYRNGLRTLRQAATHFRRHEKSAEVAQEMTDAFDRLYLEGEADRLPPVTAIALYYEFKELTPAGPKGDEMIRKLAERLVEIDLLDRGAELLDAQVKFRLEGVEKARVGTRLATVHVLANKYETAMEVLDGTEAADMPEDLAAERRHLRARTLIGMDRDEDALTMLEKDKSTEADLLRAEIHWQARDWPHATQVLSRLVRAAGAKPETPLDGKQSHLVLNLAIAQTLSNNERALERIRRDFGNAMDSGPFREAFRLIASPQTFGMLDYRTIAAKVEDVENFQTFMASYRERLLEPKQSDVN